MEEIKQAKLKALQATLDRLDKSYGKGAVMRLGDDPSESLEVITVSYTHLTLPTSQLV